MVAPGGTYDLSWNGTVREPVDMPSACYFEPGFAGETCDQRIVAPDGTYAFEIVGYDDSWCPLDMPGACECQPDESGSCTVEQYGEILNANGVAVRSSSTFPTDSSVEIVFE